MANKHVKQLTDKVKNYFEELNRLDLMAVKMSSGMMVDPEDWSDVTGEIRCLALYLSNVNSVLAMALDPKDFNRALSSRRNLVKSLKDVLSKIRLEQPDSELIPSYEKVLEDHDNTLFLLEQTSKFRNFPKAKKKFSKWSKKGLIDLGYTPFNRIEVSLIKIRNSLSEGVD